jgi:basic membrane protein A
MRRLSGVSALAGLIALGLVVSACGSKPSSTGSGGSSGSNFSACMVTDTGGINDKSFNASAWAGMQKAKADGKSATPRFLQSTSENDYGPNIAQLVAGNCNLIVTVGGLMQQATTDAAKANPKQHFAEVDAPGNGTNVLGLQYNTAQAGFLAGYLAAGYSTSGKVATYGGLDIPPVTIYMDGFWEGVQYYNKQKSKTVQVLGWSEATQNGSFAGSFTDQTKGETLATNFMQQGADVVFPVAGGTGLGAAAAAQSSAGKAVVIWVDSDGFVSDPQYQGVFLSTAYKNVADAVTTAVEGASGGTYSTKDYVGTLANTGVGLSPFHDFDSKVPAGLKSELTQIQQQIIAGTIKITSPSQPKG